MRSGHRVLVLALSLFLGATVVAQQLVFRAGTQVVPLYVTVTDAERRLVPGLTEDDFRIYDNDQPQEIAFFQAEIQPITVVLMLDTSASMTLAMDLLKAAAEQFLLRLLPEDQAKIGAFNSKIQFVSDFTSDRDDLIGSLGDLGFGNATRLYDSLEASLDVLEPFDGRRVILVFTDGADTASRSNMGRVLDRARAEEVMIYAIGLEMDYFNGMRRVRSRPDRGLRRLAEETGGGYFELKKTDELSSTFTRVAQELHSQYVLGFTPATLDGKVHRLSVSVKQPGMTARARRSYLAVTEQSASN
jgi:Ca-activated chloride channel homolog